MTLSVLFALGMLAVGLWGFRHDIRRGGVLDPWAVWARPSRLDEFCAGRLPDGWDEQAVAATLAEIEAL